MYEFLLEIFSVLTYVTLNKDKLFLDGVLS